SASASPPLISAQTWLFQPSTHVHGARCQKHRSHRNPPDWQVAWQNVRRSFPLRRESAGSPAIVFVPFPVSSPSPALPSPHNRDKIRRSRYGCIPCPATYAAAQPAASNSCPDSACPWAAPDAMPKSTVPPGLTRIRWWAKCRECESHPLLVRFPEER